MKELRGVNVRGYEYIDTAGAALEIEYHVDFFGPPHGSVPTPHLQIVAIREAGSIKYQKVSFNRALDEFEAIALVTQMNHAGRREVNLMNVQSLASWMREAAQNAADQTKIIEQRNRFHTAEALVTDRSTWEASAAMRDKALNSLVRK